MNQNNQEVNQENQNPSDQNLKERLLDIESLLLLLDSDPCLQEYHFRIIRMMHNIIKELINADDS